MGGQSGMNQMGGQRGMNQMGGPGGINQMGGLGRMSHMAGPDGMNQMAGPGRMNQMGGMGSPIGINQMRPGGMNQMQSPGGMGRGSAPPMSGTNMNQQFPNQMQMRMQGLPSQPASPGTGMARMRQPFMPFQQDGTSYSNNPQYQQNLAPPGVNESENEQASLTTKVTDPKFAAQDEMEIEKLSALQMQVKQWQQTQPVREFVQEFKNKMTGPPGVQPKEELEEEEFEKQYKEWEKQFEDWKTQNANHPNQELFKQYEKQWLQWKDEMNQRRKEIRRRRDERLLQQSRLIQSTFSASASQGAQQTVLYHQAQTQQIQPSTVFPGTFGRGPLPEQTSQQMVDTATSQENANERHTVSGEDQAGDTVSPSSSVGSSSKFPPKGAPGNALKSDAVTALSNANAKPEDSNANAQPEEADYGVKQEGSKDKVIQEKTESKVKQADSESRVTEDKPEQPKVEVNRENVEVKVEQGDRPESKGKQEANEEEVEQSESQENQENVEAVQKEAGSSTKNIETETIIPKQEAEDSKKADVSKNVTSASSEDISRNIVAADNDDIIEAISDDELATFDDQNEGSTDGKSNSLRSSRAAGNSTKDNSKPTLDRFGRDMSIRCKYKNDEKRQSKDRDSRERSYDRDHKSASRDSHAKSRYYDSRSSRERSHDKDHREESSSRSKHSDDRPSSSERRPAQYRDERYVNKEVELKEQEIKLLQEQKSKLESLKALQENISLKSLIGEQQKKKEEQQRNEDAKKSALGLIGRAYDDTADEVTTGPSGQRQVPPAQQEDVSRRSVRHLDDRYRDVGYDSRSVEPRPEGDYVRPGWYRGPEAGRVSQWERREYDRPSAFYGRDRMDSYRDDRYPEYRHDPYERYNDPYRYPERLPETRYDDRYSSRLQPPSDNPCRRLQSPVERDLGAPPTKIQVIDYGHTRKPVEASHSTVLSGYRTTPPPPPPIGHSRTSPPTSRLRGQSPPWHHSLQLQDDVRGMNPRDSLRGYESAYQDPYNRTATDPYIQSDTYSHDYDSYHGSQRLEGTPPAPSRLDRYADAERRGKSHIAQTNQAEAVSVKLEIISIEDLLNKPGRLTRPRNVVIILRGPPGAGKSYLAKLIKEKEQAMGGTAPRIIALDDYFMVEKEKMVPDPESGRMAMQKVLEYEYEAEMEEAYRSSMLKAFKKTIEDGFFNFVIVDACHAQVREFEEMWSFAKQRGSQVYIAEVMGEKNVCQKRNIHGRTVADIVGIINAFEPAPRHMIQLDIRSLLQDAAITEVEMEDYTGDEVKEANEPADEDDDEEGGFIPKSRWEKMDETKLDRLDGLIMAHKHQKPTLEEFLQLPDDYEQRQSQPGKKRVRWADIEERKATQRARDIGFVVGQTDWKRMLDDSHVMMALQKTKYI